MSEIKLISPMLDNFDMGEPISSHDGVRCCPAMRKDADDRYIVKIISVPASQVQLDALLLSGAFSDEAAALAYFKDVADGIVEEVRALEQLSEFEGFTPVIDWQVVPMDEGVGYDVYLLSPYRKTLEKHFRRNPMTHLSAINLGLDICAALAVCRRYGYLYVDLRPGNIYLNDQQQHRIGDIGLVKLDSLKYTSLSDRYRSVYTAPEIADAFAPLNETVDIYAAGLILYQAYNDGLLPFRDDVLPGEPLPAPAYADYEMSEIILKACAPKPEDRWQDPVEMGQAIASYMQRNGANDTPIVPVAVAAEPVAVPDLSAEVSDEQVPAEEIEQTENEAAPTADASYTEDSMGNFSFLDASEEDETLPDEDEDISYTEVTNEVSDILNQADDLIAHPTPEGVIQPEPITVEIPPMPESEAESDTDNDSETEETENANEEQPAELAADNADIEAQQEDNEVSVEDTYEDSDAAQQQQKKKPRHALRWVIASISVILVAALLWFGYFFYKNYYLKTIDAITLDGSRDTLVVSLATQADNSLLTVVCADAYGNILEQPVIDGKAVFTGLAPNSAYTVTVLIDGFHHLSGETSSSYSTPAQTNIAQLSAVCGAENASVYLSFTVTGEDPKNWSVTYSAEGEEEKTAQITGHMITITGLTLGKEYTFRLIAEGALYVTGTEEVKYTVSEVVRPENLQVVSCVDNKLTATWTVPNGVQLEYWTVRCHNDSGYDETIQVTEPIAIFDELDHTAAYTVDVVAAGMSVGQTVEVKANSISITDFAVDDSVANTLTVKWNCTAAIPKDGWILQYTVDGSDPKQVVSQNGTEVQISPVVPGVTYQFTLLTANDTGVLGGIHTYKSQTPTTFSGFYVEAKDMEFKMCLTPDVAKWDRYDLEETDYTTTFRIGQKASFLIRLRTAYKNSYDEVATVFVIRDQHGKVVRFASQTEAWRSMWSYSYCTLDIPEIPSTAGTYTVYVYFNGGLAAQQDFTVTE